MTFLPSSHLLLRSQPFNTAATVSLKSILAGRQGISEFFNLFLNGDGRSGASRQRRQQAPRRATAQALRDKPVREEMDGTWRPPQGVRGWLGCASGSVGGEVDLEGVAAGLDLDLLLHGRQAHEGGR